MSVSVIRAAGLLFIGDPHLTTGRIARRTDASFFQTIYRKMEQAVAIAKAEDLVIVIPGDLLDRGDDDAARLQVALIRLFRGVCAWYLPGNHSLTIGRSIREALTDDHTVTVLAEAGIINLIQGVSFILETPDGTRTAVGGTSWGHRMPSDVRPLLQEAREGDDDAGVDHCIWVTHDDVATANPYPGAIRPFPIAGCNLVVNGHVHKTEAPVEVGGTTWFIPGNIARLSVDARDHVPSAWSWRPENSPATGAATVYDEYLLTTLPTGMRRHVLAHEADVFNLTGYLIAEGEAPAVPDAPLPEQEEINGSAYAALLREENAGDMALSDDDTVLLADLEAVLDEHQADQHLRRLVLDLVEAE